MHQHQTSSEIPSPALTPQIGEHGESPLDSLGRDALPQAQQETSSMMMMESTSDETSNWTTGMTGGLLSSPDNLAMGFRDSNPSLQSPINPFSGRIDIHPSMVWDSSLPGNSALLPNSLPTTAALHLNPPENFGGINLDEFLSTLGDDDNNIDSNNDNTRQTRLSWTSTTTGSHDSPSGGGLEETTTMGGSSSSRSRSAAAAMDLETSSSSLLDSSLDSRRWECVLSRTSLPVLDPNSRFADMSPFLYGVKSTSTYCRPTCPARRPKEWGTVVFVENAKDAENQGYKPCKRCRPNEDSGEAAEQRQKMGIEKAMKMVETRSKEIFERKRRKKKEEEEGGGGSPSTIATTTATEDQGGSSSSSSLLTSRPSGKGGKGGEKKLRFTLKEMADAAGMSEWHFHRVFKKRVGVTPDQWAKAAVEKVAITLEGD